MTRLRIMIRLTRHGLLLWRTGQLRFRLETFGIYYPALPFRSPWWRLSPHVVAMLIHRAGSYGAWLMEMDDLGRHGPTAWWGGRRSHPLRMRDDQ